MRRSGEDLKGLERILERKGVRNWFLSKRGGGNQPMHLKLETSKRNSPVFKQVYDWYHLERGEKLILPP